MSHSKLYFWKDKESCTKYYMEREGKDKEDVEHKVSLAMMFGCVVSFNKDADRMDFEGSMGVRTYD